MDTPNSHRISERAYALWEEAGRPEGRAEEFWYQAEREAGVDLTNGIGDEAAAKGFARDVETPKPKAKTKSKAAPKSPVKSAAKRAVKKSTTPKK